MKSPRLFGWLITTVILLGLIAVSFPQQIGVSLYKLSLVCTAVDADGPARVGDSARVR